MSYKPEKKPASPRRRRKVRTPTPDVRSDQLTATHVATCIRDAQEDLADLLVEFRYMSRFSELDDLAWVIYRLNTLRKVCESFAETGTWDD